MSRHELAIAVPPALRDEISKSLYWLDRRIRAITFLEREPAALAVELADETEAETLLAQIEATVKRLVKVHASFPSKVIYESPLAPAEHVGDPFEALMAHGWIHPSADGSFAYSGLMLDLYRALDLSVARAALSLGASEHKFPALISLETLRRSGYLENFPHQVKFVSHLPEQQDWIEAFKGRLGDDAGAALASAAPVYDAHVLSPTVCYHYYHRLADTTLKGDAVSVTASSACFRYESKAQRSLRRLSEFNMREIVVVGTPQEIETRHQQLYQALLRLFKLFHLAGRIQTASDPFFLDSYVQQRIYQVSFDLKYEAQAFLPQDGDHIAIASLNLHQDHFGKLFNIRLPNGEAANSCCLGFGLDRWCFAVFSQHGLQEERWPQDLRDLLAQSRHVFRQLGYGEDQHVIGSA